MMPCGALSRPKPSRATYPHGSADLPDSPIASSPGLVSRPYVGVQSVAECNAQPVGQGEPFPPDPFLGRPFGIGDRHGFDL
jgi:hypothetical protein